MTSLRSDDLRISCCVIARGRLQHLHRMLTGLARQHRAPDEVVVVSMGDSDVVAIAETEPVVTAVEMVDHADHDPLPLARARNIAAASTTGDLVVFLDVDCIASPELVADYVRQRRPGLLMGNVRYLPPNVPEGPTDWSVADLRRLGRAHPARPNPATAERTAAYELFWSLNFAVERATWRALGGFDERYRGYGGEDTDLGFEARRRCVPAWFLSGAEAFHQHHETHDPPVHHLRDIVENARRFHDKWGVWPMTGWLDAFARNGLIVWDDHRIDIAAGGVP